MRYPMYFLSEGEKRKIATVETVDDVYKVIQQFIDDANEKWGNNFQWYYTRIMYDKETNETRYDVGSHTEFFVVDGDFVSKYEREEKKNEKRNETHICLPARFNDTNQRNYADCPGKGRSDRYAGTD